VALALSLGTPQFDCPAFVLDGGGGGGGGGGERLGAPVVATATSATESSIGQFEHTYEMDDAVRISWTFVPFCCPLFLCLFRTVCEHFVSLFVSFL
jgi:hypothetical protein